MESVDKYGANALVTAKAQAQKKPEQDAFISLEDFKSHLPEQDKTEKLPTAHTGGLSRLDSAMSADLISGTEAGVNNESPDDQVRAFLRQTISEYRQATSAYEDTQEKEAAARKPPTSMGIG